MKIGLDVGIARTWANDMVINWSDAMRKARPRKLAATDSFCCKFKVKFCFPIPEKIAARVTP